MRSIAENWLYDSSILGGGRFSIEGLGGFVAVISYHRFWMKRVDGVFCDHENCEDFNFSE